MKEKKKIGKKNFEVQIDAEADAFSGMSNLKLCPAGCAKGLRRIYCLGIYKYIKIYFLRIIYIRSKYNFEKILVCVSFNILR